MKNLKNKKRKINLERQKGYVTLLVMLIVATVSFGLILSALRSSVNSTQDSLAILKGAEARASANASMEDALYAIYSDPYIAAGTVGTVICTGAPPETCTTSPGHREYTIQSTDHVNTSCEPPACTPYTSQASTNWQILATGVADGVTQRIQVNAVLNNGVVLINNWQENDFSE